MIIAESSKDVYPGNFGFFEIVLNLDFVNNSGYDMF